MTLKKCKDCGNEVCTKAKVCPHCGAPVKADMGYIWGSGTLFLILILVGIFASQFDEQDTNPTSNIPDIVKQPQPKKEVATPKVEPKPKQVIKIDPEFALEEKTEEYRTTNFDSQFRPDPNSDTEISRVPPNTKLKVLEKRTVQQGMMKNNWYKVNYKGKTGWISGWNMKEEEELVITSVEEMERNYAKRIGPKPVNDFFTGKIDIVVNWLNKNAHDPSSIEYVQWYGPFLNDNYWNCRVEFRAKNALGILLKEDKIFKVRNGSVVNVVDKF